MTTAYTALEASLGRLGLEGMLAALPQRVAAAQREDHSALQLLQSLCEDELAHRASDTHARAARRARLDSAATFDAFDLTTLPPAAADHVRVLAALTWLRAAESTLIYGADGSGKTHLAQALGHLALRAGVPVRFTHTRHLLEDLARTRNKPERMAHKYVWPQLLILDDFPGQRLTRSQVEDLFELLADRAERGGSLVTTSTYAPHEWYPLFAASHTGDLLLDQLLNSSHEVLLVRHVANPRQTPHPELDLESACAAPGRLSPLSAAARA